MYSSRWSVRSCSHARAAERSARAAARSRAPATRRTGTSAAEAAEGRGVSCTRRRSAFRARGRNDLDDRPVSGAGAQALEALEVGDEIVDLAGGEPEGSQRGALVVELDHVAQRLERPVVH